MATQFEQNHSLGRLNQLLSTMSVQEDPGDKERFYRFFQNEVTVLQEQIDQLVDFSLVAGERQDAIDHCLAGIARLTNNVTDATDYLPAYDQRTYSEAIKALSEKLKETRSKFAPKSRFSFKTSQKNSSAISLTDATSLAPSPGLSIPFDRLGLDSSAESSVATTPAHLKTPSNEADTLGDLPSFPKNYNEEISKPGGPIRKPSFSQAPSVTISDHKSLHIILPSSAAHATSSGSLTNLKKCIVDMSVPTSSGAPFAGLSLRDIDNSLIIAGEVAGAAHITGVHDSTIVVSARQVRMHSCNNVDIYLMCPSRPIIEDCGGVRFAPVPTVYDNKSTGITSENLWDQVDDFKWLKAEHSPNWSILPEENRLSEEVWTKVVPGEQGMGLDDILRKIGIKG